RTPVACLLVPPEREANCQVPRWSRVNAKKVACAPLAACHKEQRVIVRSQEVDGTRPWAINQDEPRERATELRCAGGRGATASVSRLQLTDLSLQAVDRRRLGDADPPRVGVRGEP